MDPRPKLAALAVLPHQGHVLLVRRRNPPDAGLWGYPGGHVDWGETVAEAAVRELAEETGVRGAAAGWLTNLDIILREGGAVRHHFLLAAVLCRWRAGAPQAADDVSEAEWVPQAEVLSRARPLSQDVDRVLRLALARA
ncbi:NUDIX hydrolase [Psychromarinibacter sp. C21-152]|uniref:NUDIX hydrolase n=1 Tax=Psychromarinibacter sediminicola TaxID=3033385 RepID=A0AAE3TBJ5_9RHOB|nr:NUDIX hydrolase [Psychromarinibacter sediminicola]MDF0603938.1 NUDIX hydrolase [Psychromarinibacter sediminicola]